MSKKKRIEREKKKESKQYIWCSSCASKLLAPLWRKKFRCPDCGHKITITE